MKQNIPGGLFFCAFSIIIIFLLILPPRSRGLNPIPIPESDLHVPLQLSNDMYLSHVIILYYVQVVPITMYMHNVVLVSGMITLRLQPAMFVNMFEVKVQPKSNIGKKN